VEAMQVPKHASQSYVLLLLYLNISTLFIHHGILGLNVKLNYSW